MYRSIKYSTFFAHACTVTILQNPTDPNLNPVLFFSGTVEWQRTVR